MKVFAFSDTHFTNKFNQREFNFLKDKIDSVDLVIINGDFWEGLMGKFDDFLNSDWKKLFPILKQKAIYIYGNHDDPHLSDERVNQFCKDAVKDYTLKTNKRTYFFTHGQNYLYPREEIESPDWTRANDKKQIYTNKIADVIQNVLISVLGPHAYPKKFNNMTLDERKSITSLDNLLVCGHSHTPQYNKDINFIDLGFFNYGWANYMLIDDEGNFELKSEKY